MKTDWDWAWNFSSMDETPTHIKIKLSKDFLATSSLIQTVHVNEDKKIVVVVFKDGDRQIVKCSKDDEFDVEVGFSLAFTRHMFKSKTQVRKFIAKNAKVIQKAKEEDHKEEK